MKLIFFLAFALTLSVSAQIKTNELTEVKKQISVCKTLKIENSKRERLYVKAGEKMPAAEKKSAEANNERLKVLLKREASLELKQVPAKSKSSLVH